MKSRAKVISQKHIREIPATMFSFKRFGILSHGVYSNETVSRKEKRHSRNHVQRSLSRRINMNKN